MTKNNLISCLLFCLISQLGISQNTITLEETTLTRKELTTGLIIPWEITWGPDDHIWVTERRGKIHRVDPANGNTTEILDIRSQVINEDDNGGGSEYGMLGMTFHPDFENSPLVYVVYNYSTGGFFNIEEKLVSFEWNGSDLINETIILDNVPGGTFHNGSRLIISRDNKIFMTTGDARDPAGSLDKDLLSGKILRINLDGSVPSDNPTQGSYVYSYGHRNPQGLVYGPNDILYSAEHGDLRSDEVNIIEPDRNYGWPEVEGECNTSFEMIYCEQNNVKEPLWDWSPCVGVSSLDYYQHEAIPEWDGKLLLAVLGGLSLRQPRISVLTLSEDGQAISNEDVFFEDDGRIRDLCINPHTGSIYFATNGAFYPGEGPNQIIEYVNEAYTSSNKNLAETGLEISLSPNPANDILSLNCSKELVGANYEIYSYQGKIVLNGTVNTTYQQIELGNLDAGNYFIKVVNNNGFLSKTFSVVR